MTRYIYEEGAGYLIKAIAEDGRLLDVVEPAEIMAALLAADAGGPEATEEPAAPAMPAGWTIRNGCLYSGEGCVLNPKESHLYGTATILAAVEAWCAAMEEPDNES